MHVTGMSWVGVLTEDFEATLHFFSEIMGLSLEYRDEAKALAHFRLLSGQLLEIYGPSNRQRKEKYRWFNGPALGFAVEDIGLARQEMISKGASFITELETWEDEAWSMFLGPEDKLFEILRLARRYPQKPAKILGFSWAGVVMQDFDRAVRFFSQVMEMPLRRDDRSEVAHFWLPTGHRFEVFGPNNKGGQLMSHITIGFEVADVGQVRAEMEQRGVEFLNDVDVTSVGEVYTYFRGPDSYLYAIWKQGYPTAE